MSRLLAVLILTGWPGLLWAQPAKEAEVNDDPKSETARERYLFIDNGGHAGSLAYAAFFYDKSGPKAKRRLFTVGRDRAFIIWDVNSGERLRYFRPPYYSGKDQSIQAVRLIHDPNDDCKSVVFATIDETKKKPYIVYHLNLATEKLTLLHDSATDEGVSFSGDGKHFVCKIDADKDTTLICYDIQEPKEGVKTDKVGEFKSTLKVAAMALTPDGKRIAVRNRAGAYQVLNLPRGDLVVKVEPVPKREKDTQKEDKERAAWSQFRWVGERDLVVWKRGERDEDVPGGIQVWRLDLKEARADKVREWVPSAKELEGEFKESYLRRVVGIAVDKDTQDVKLLVDFYCPQTKARARGTHYRAAVVTLAEKKTTFTDTGNELTCQFVFGDGLAVSRDKNLAVMGEGANCDLLVFDLNFPAVGKPTFPVKQVLGYKADGLTEVRWRNDDKALGWRVGKPDDEKGSERVLDLGASLGMLPLKEQAPKMGTYGFMEHLLNGITISPRRFEDDKDVIDIKGGPVPRVVGNRYYLNRTGLFEGKLLLGIGVSRFDVYDLADGKPKYQHPGYPAYLTAESGNHKYVALVRNDQTIEIYHPTPKKEEFLLRIYAQGADWVAWTREGYYACSPGADRFLKLHVHRKDQLARTYPAGQFRAQLYKPDVIAEILQTGEVEKAVAKATAKAQMEPAPRLLKTVKVDQIKFDEVPQVEFLTPRLPQEQVRKAEYTVTVKATGGEKASEKDADKPAPVVMLYVDGKPWDKGMKRDNKACTVEWKVELSEGEHRLRALARSEAGLTSFSNTVEVGYFKGPPPKPGPPALYVLTVGTNYADRKDLELQFAEKDAAALKDLFTAHKTKGLFTPVYEGGVTARSLIGKDATLLAINKELALLAKAQPQDTVIIHFAGHGVLEGGESGPFYLYPDGVNVKDLKKSALSGEDFKEALRGIKARQVIVLLDACYSGGQGCNQLARELSDEEAPVVVICSAGKNEKAREKGVLKNGCFTYRVMEALRGEVDFNPSTGRICLGHLQGHLANAVPLDTEGDQTPTNTVPATISPATFELSTRPK